MEENKKQKDKGELLFFVLLLMFVGAEVELITEIEEPLQYFIGSGSDILISEVYELRAEIREIGGELISPDYELQTSGIQSSVN